MGTTVPYVPRVCSVDGCDNPHRARGWCMKHYERWMAHGTTDTLYAEPGWVNPLVCVCETPDADPRRDFGMCQVCKRKPLALMAVPS